MQPIYGAPTSAKSRSAFIPHIGSGTLKWPGKTPFPLGTRIKARVLSVCLGLSPTEKRRRRQRLDQVSLHHAARRAETVLPAEEEGPFSHAKVKTPPA